MNTKILEKHVVGEFFTLILKTENLSKSDTTQYIDYEIECSYLINNEWVETDPSQYYDPDIKQVIHEHKNQYWNSEVINLFKSEKMTGIEDYLGVQEEPLSDEQIEQILSEL